MLITQMPSITPYNRYRTSPPTTEHKHKDSDINFTLITGRTALWKPWCVISVCSRGRSWRNAHHCSEK